MDLFFIAFRPLLSTNGKTDGIRESDLQTPPIDMQAPQLIQAFRTIWNKKKFDPPSRVPVLWNVLHHLIFKQFWYAGFCRLMSDALVLVGPVLIELVVKAAQNSDQKSLFLYSTLLLLSSFFQACLPLSLYLTLCLSYRSI
jgi:hypothetical protein